MTNTKPQPQAQNLKLELSNNRRWDSFRREFDSLAPARLASKVEMKTKLKRASNLGKAARH
jgi:hypothetical protein